MTQKKGYDRTALKKLDAVDWSAIFPRLINYARAKEQVLIKIGSDLDFSDLLQEAMARVYGQGTNGKYRNWDSEAFPDLSEFLKVVMHEIVRQETSRVTKYPLEQLCWEEDPGEEKALSINNKDGVAAYLRHDPEKILIQQEEIDILNEEIEKISEKDEDLGLVLMCIDDGKIKSREIAAELDLPVTQVYNLQKRLRRRFIKWKNKRKQDRRIVGKVTNGHR